MNALLTTSPYDLPVGSIARSSIESSGRAIWLLDDDLHLHGDIRKRIARRFLDREDDIRRRHKLAAQANHADARSLEKLREEARKSISSPLYFFRPEIVEDERSGKLTVCGQRLPGTGELINYGLASETSPRAKTKWLFEYLSVMTHPTAFAIMEAVETGQSDSPYMHPREDPAFVARLTTATVAAFYKAWLSIATWLDNGSLEADQLWTLSDDLSSRINS